MARETKSEPKFNVGDRVFIVEELMLYVEWRQSCHIIVKVQKTKAGYRYRIKNEAGQRWALQQKLAPKVEFRRHCLLAKIGNITSSIECRHRNIKELKNESKQEKRALQREKERLRKLKLALKKMNAK